MYYDDLTPVLQPSRVVASPFRWGLLKNLIIAELIKIPNLVLRWKIHYLQWLQQHTSPPLFASWIELHIYSLFVCVLILSSFCCSSLLNDLFMPKILYLITVKTLVLHSCMVWCPWLYTLFFGPCQMLMRTMFPKFCAIFRWSPQKFKIGSLLYIVDLFGVLRILLITCCILIRILLITCCSTPKRSTIYSKLPILNFCGDHIKMAQNLGNIVLMSIWQGPEKSV